MRDEVKSKDLPGPQGGGSPAAAHHDHVDHAELRMRAAATTDGGGRPGDAAEEAGGQVAPLGRPLRRLCLLPGVGLGVASTAAAAVACPVSTRRDRG